MPIAQAVAANSSRGAALASPSMDRLLPMAVVVYTVGLCPATIYAKIKQGTFPKQRRITARRIGFLESEIRAYVQSREAA